MSQTGWTRDARQAPKNGRDVLVRLEEAPNSVLVMKWVSRWVASESAWYWNTDGSRVELSAKQFETACWHQPPEFIYSKVEPRRVPQVGEKITYRMSESNAMGEVVFVGDTQALIKTARALKPLYGLRIKTEGMHRYYLMDLKDIHYRGRPAIGERQSSEFVLSIKVGDLFAYRTKATDQKIDSSTHMGKAEVIAVSNGMVLLQGIYAPAEGSSELNGINFFFTRPESVVRTWPAIGGKITP